MGESFAWFGGQQGGEPEVVRWEVPTRRGVCEYRGKLVDRPGAPQAAALRTRPNTWAVVFEGGFGDVTIHAHAIRVGGRDFRYAGNFEVVTRRTGNLGVIYARYVGLLR